MRTKKRAARPGEKILLLEPACPMDVAGDVLEVEEVDGETAYAYGQAYPMQIYEVVEEA